MSKKTYTVNPALEITENEKVPEHGNYVVVTDNGDGKKPRKHSNNAKHEEKVTTNVDFEMDFDFDDVDDWENNDYVDIDDTKVNVIAKVVKFVQSAIFKSTETLQRWTRNHFFSILFILVYLVYFIAAMIYHFGDDGSIRLLVCTALGLIIYTRSLWLRRGLWIFNKLSGEEGFNPKALKWIRLIIRWILYMAVLGISIWTIVDNADSWNNLRGLPGLAVFIILCVFFSTNPTKINWHTVFWGIGLQFIFAICTLKFHFGRDAIRYIQDRLDEFFANSGKASTLIFGPETSQHQLLFEALPVIFFVSAVMGVLYHVGAMQFTIGVIGTVFSFIFDTQPVESTSVASGIFLDGTTAILSLSPFLEFQSKSQLFMILTSCFASLGGAYLSILAKFNVPMKNILPAMVISAPATFAVCKMIMPETRPQNSKRNKDTMKLQDEQRSNVIDAFQVGALLGLRLVGNIVAIAFAFVSTIEWLNSTFEWFGERVGKKGLTLEYIFEFVLYPVALAMGIHPDECRLAGRILGIRFISTNFIAFINMMPLVFNRKIYQAYMAATNNTGPVQHMENDMFLVNFNKTLPGGIITERTEVILTFSLCGFSSIVVLAFSIAAFNVLIPKRRVWLSKIAIPALVAGNIANCMTACLAGLFYSK